MGGGAAVSAAVGRLGCAVSIRVMFGSVDGGGGDVPALPSTLGPID